MNNGEETEPAAAHLVLLPLGDKACTMHIRKSVFGRGYERKKNIANISKKLFNIVFAKSKRDLALISAL